MHDKQVIHRDIKPENIIRRSDGELVLVDFGAAKTVKPTALSVTGTVIGTAGYASRLGYPKLQPKVLQHNHSSKFAAISH